MRREFHFDTDLFNFWPVYECICRYYPLGISKGRNGSLYNRYSGIQKYHELVNSNIHQDENWRIWTNLYRQVNEETGLALTGKTFGQAPGVSASLLIEEVISEYNKETKELCFSVSLLGSFYQIYYKTTVWDYKYKMLSIASQEISSSSIIQYESEHRALRRNLQNIDNNMRIIPISIGQMYIKGLEVPYLDSNDCTINQSLFDNHLDPRRISPQVNGDIMYGYDEWAIS